MSRGLGKIEQAILTVLRHGDWAGKPGNAHTVRQLRFWVYALTTRQPVCQLGACDASDLSEDDRRNAADLGIVLNDDIDPNHKPLWLNPALEASVRRGLASLERKGLVKKHIVPYPAWQGMPPQIQWSLSDAEVKEYETAKKQRAAERKKVLADA